MCNMFSFAHLNGEIRCQTCADVGCVNFQSHRPKQHRPHPETTTSFPHSSPCHFVLLLRSLFKNSFVKPQKIIELCGTRLRQNSGGETLTLQRGITGAPICAGPRAKCWKPQPPQHSWSCKTNSHAPTLTAGCWTRTSGPLEPEGARNQNNIMEVRLSEFQGSRASFTPAGEASEASLRMMSTCR